MSVMYEVVMDHFVDILSRHALSGDGGFAAGVSFLALLIMYVCSRIYRAFAKFVTEFLDLWLSRKRRMDDIDVAREVHELEIAKQAFESLRMTGENRK